MSNFTKCIIRQCGRETDNCKFLHSKNMKISDIQPNFKPKTIEKEKFVKVENKYIN
jgi:hypothetical protein